MKAYKVDFGSLPWQSPAKGVRFKTFQQNGRKLRLVEFSRDFIEPDWCSKGHIGYVLEGEGRLDFSDHVERLKAGEGVFIPAGIENKHKSTVISDTMLLILVEDV